MTQQIYTPLYKSCPHCGQPTMFAWRGVKLAGEDCHSCGKGKWWLIGQEKQRGAAYHPEFPAYHPEFDLSKTKKRKVKNAKQ